jgi:hypothetical protein
VADEFYDVCAKMVLALYDTGEALAALADRYRIERGTVA